MLKLDIRVHYDVTLFNFVDSLSKWSPFVGDHVYTYFIDQCGINEVAARILKKYAKIRKKLDWKREIDLMNWAFGGFEDNPEFNDLLPSLRYFEQKKCRDGKLLKDKLLDATKQITKIVTGVEKRFKKLDVDGRVKLFMELFGSRPWWSLLPCYLTFSPHNSHTEGGANGDGIYTQIIISLSERQQVVETVEVILHEYMHKMIQPGAFFESNGESAIYKREYQHIYPGTYSSFVEEVVIYTLCDVMTLGSNAAERREYYRTQNDDEMFLLWRVTQEVLPILEQYEKDSKDKGKTLKELDTFFKSLVVEG